MGVSHLASVLATVGNALLDLSPLAPHPLLLRQHVVNKVLGKRLDGIDRCPGK